jgi:hypothetical protein
VQASGGGHHADPEHGGPAESKRPASSDYNHDGRRAQRWGCTQHNEDPAGALK